MKLNRNYALIFEHCFIQVICTITFVFNRKRVLNGLVVEIFNTFENLRVLNKEKMRKGFDCNNKKNRT